jgi:inhibitor of KinA
MGYTLARIHMALVAGARFVRSSDQSVLVYFGPPDQGGAKRAPQGKILVEANENVRRLLQILSSRPIEGVRNLHPAYCSLLAKFDPQKWRHEELEKKLCEYLNQLEEVRLPEPHLVELPVCYLDEFGPDLKDVAAAHGMTPEQVIRLHTSTTYLVYFLGFVPGFAYLGELPEALVTSRHATPRRKVPPGSVGIAGNQTGVYPCETPGGWRLLGRTPLAMFRPERHGLCLLSIGDRVQFKAISREQFAALENT